MDRPRRQFQRMVVGGVLVLAGVLALTQGGGAAARGDGPARQASGAGNGSGAVAYLGAHSMLYLNTPFSAKKAMFAQAADMGASNIRLDIELSAVFPGPRQDSLSIGQLLNHMGHSGHGGLAELRPAPDWAWVDQYMQLARQYHLHVLADLTSTPSYMARCPAHTPRRRWSRCPPSHPEQWGQDAGAIAAHTRGVINNFEIINEPDSPAFLGTPRQYAAVLSAAFRAIHAANPKARVVLGGLRHIGSWGRHWMDAVLATPGAHAVHSFDVANIHVRVPPTRAGGVVCGWRTYFQQKGFAGPLWVTETGYPANPAEQRDPGYRNGAPAQARWLAAVIPTMLRAGAGKVFVTERDFGRGPFASEGVLDTAPWLTSDPRIRRRPSFYAVQHQAAEGWREMMSRYLHSQVGRTTAKALAGTGC